MTWVRPRDFAKLTPMLNYPGFDPVAVALGPVKLRWYGIMYVIGFLSAWGLARRRAARNPS